MKFARVTRAHARVRGPVVARSARHAAPFMSAAAVAELCGDLERLWGGAHEAVAQQEGGGADRLVYGEVLCESVSALLDEFARAFPGGANFVDVGSGRGKAVLTAACHPLVRASHGVELLRCHHDCAVSLLDAAQARGLLPAGAAVSVSHADAFASALWAPQADVVLCNCVTWPASMLDQLAVVAESSRPGSIYLLVSASLPSPAFRALGVRSALCSWGEAATTITVAQRQLHGSAWQRRRLHGGIPVDYLLSDASELLRLLPIPHNAALLLPSIGDCPLAAQLALHPSVASVHAFDLCPAAVSAARRAAPPKLRVFAADSEEVRFCCSAECALERCLCEEFQKVPASLFDAAIDQSCLDALLPISPTAAHRSLACTFAALRPAGRLLLLSHAPPSQALPFLSGPLPGCAWESQIEHTQLSGGGGFAYILVKPTARSLLVSGSRVLPAPHERYAPACRRCSYAVCGRVMFSQPLYECLDCAMESLCEVCATGGCHAGHRMARLEAGGEQGRGRWSGAASGDGGAPLLRDTTLGYCDCGWTGACRAV